MKTTANITLSDNDKVAIISNMNTMLSAGIPILETVDALLEDTKGNQRRVLEELKQDLSQGQHVYFTFSKFPKVFDKVTINIVKASEEAGTLDVTLKDLRDNLRKEMKFNDKIKSAMTYPAFVIVVFIAVFTIILLVVVPKISTVFSRLNVIIPLPTRIMISLSQFFLTYPIPSLVAIGFLIVGFIYLYRTHKHFFIGIFVSLPVVSKLAQSIDLTRFTRSLYLLLNAGIPIIGALELAQEVIVDRKIKQAIMYAKNVVMSGKKFSDGLKDNKSVIPSLMIRIVQAGERSGSLDKAMLDVSEYLDYQVSNRLQTVTTLIEPILLVVIGIFVGSMMIAIIGPIYSLIGQIGAH